MTTRHGELSPEETWKYAEKSLEWHGWGSPVGLGLFLLALGVTAALIRFTFWG